MEGLVSLDGPMFGLASYPIAFFLGSLALMGLIEFISFVKLDKLKYQDALKAIYGVGSYKKAFARDPNIGY